MSKNVNYFLHSVKRNMHTSQTYEMQQFILSTQIADFVCIGLILLKTLCKTRQIWKITRILDSDDSIYAWSYNYRYLACSFELKLQKCIEVVKCLHSPTQNCIVIDNSAKPASCSHNIPCFLCILDAVQLVLLKRALEQRNPRICDKFHSSRTN